MKDLNFFEPYIEKKEFKIDKELIYYSAIIILVMCMIFYGIINQIKINRLSKKVTKLGGQAENEKVKAKVEELQFQEEEINNMKEKVEKLKLVDEYIVEEDIINEFLLQTINSRIPDDVFLKSIAINTYSIQIEGISKDKYSIAEFEYSLKNSEGFDNTFISNIYFENGYYNFSLNIGLKDEDEDGKHENGVQEENKSQENQSN